MTRFAPVSGRCQPIVQNNTGRLFTLAITAAIQVLVIDASPT